MARLNFNIMKYFLYLTVLGLNIYPLKLIVISGIKQLRITKIDLFYVSILLIGVTNYILLSVANNTSLKYTIVFLISSIIILFAFFLSVAVRQIAPKIQYIHLKLFFLLNILILISTFIYYVFYFKSVMIFDVGGDAVGDFFRGVFQNSHILMIIFSFYSILFLSRKEYWNYLSTFIAMIFASFMGGFLIYICIITLLSIFILPKKLVINTYLILSLGAVFFIAYNMGNIIYALDSVAAMVSDRPPRKITSFIQTYEFLQSGIKELLFGAGMANFSSRMAFVAGGEYVSWYPDALIYKSQLFNANHFSHWNYQTLSIPYNAGTANQPFSFYNQIFGEYGVLGFLSFCFFYITGFFPQIKYSAPKLLILALMLGYFALDYWFEYLSVILFFELFMFIPSSLYIKGMDNH